MMCIVYYQLAKENSRGGELFYLSVCMYVWMCAHTNTASLEETCNISSFLGGGKTLGT